MTIKDIAAALGLSLGALLACAPSHAAPVDLTITKNDAEIDNGTRPIDPLTITFGALPASATDLTVTFRVRGDFNAAGGGLEVIDLSADGFAFGTWLDQVDGNDQISGPAGDIGDQYASIIEGTATIPLASLLPLLADGQLTFTFDYGVGVGNLLDGDLAEVRIQYRSADVPEPSSALLAGLALFGLAGASRLRRR